MNRHRIRILHVLPRFYPGGGIDTFVALACRYLDPDLFSTDVICHEMKQPDYAGLVEQNGGSVTVLEPFSLRTFPTLRQQFRQYLAQHSAYDIVHCHMANAGFMYLREANAVGVPVRILHSHQDHYADTWSHAIRNVPLLALARRQATDYCAASAKAGDFLFKEKPYTVLRNGVDTSVFHYDEASRMKVRSELAIPDSSYVFGFVGRLTAQKNPEFALKVVADYIKTHHAGDAIVLGDGAKYTALHSLAHDLGIADHVHFLGEVSNPSAYYSAMDVLLMPSLYEGLPFTLVEAQACGLPALVSETVSREAQLSSNLKFLSLNDGIQAWSAALPPKLTAVQRANGVDVVKQAGFDQQSAIESLASFYQKTVQLRMSGVNNDVC